jgi:hypothetical protein
MGSLIRLNAPACAESGDPRLRQSGFGPGATPLSHRLRGTGQDPGDEQ